MASTTGDLYDAATELRRLLIKNGLGIAPRPGDEDSATRRVMTQVIAQLDLVTTALVTLSATSRAKIDSVGVSDSASKAAVLRRLHPTPSAQAVSVAESVTAALAP